MVEKCEDGFARDGPPVLTTPCGCALSHFLRFMLAPVGVPLCRSWGPFIGVALFLVALGYGAFAYIQHYNKVIKPTLKPAKKEKLPKGMTVRRK